MNTLIKLWNWLDGKKTNIGASILLILLFINQVVIGIWSFNPEWLGNVVETLQWVGGILTTGGLVHQGVKANEIKPQ